MYRGLSVAVVVPARDEARAIGGVVRGVPAFVDHVLVIDDGSRDGTATLARAEARPGLEVIAHARSQGVGGAIVSGYRRALALGADVSVVMAGDGQMDPADLPALLDPLADGLADYVKGNRFWHKDVWREMPVTRIVGNVCLSVAAKVVTGYGGIFDSQCGYCAVSRATLLALDLDRLFVGYGYPIDFLARLYRVGARVCDVRVRPIYGAGWKSGIRLRALVHPIPWVLLRSLGMRVAGGLLSGRSAPVLGAPSPRRALPEPTAPKARWLAARLRRVATRR